MRIAVRLLASILAFSAGCSLCPSARASQFDPQFMEQYNQWKRSNRCEIISLYFCPNWYYASRVNSERVLKGRVVFQLNQNGDVLVNPKGSGFEFMWRDAVRLEDISQSVALAGLGGRVNKDRTITCDLLTENGSFENNVYHLDLKFDGEKLASYRVRGCGVVAPSWVEVIGKVVDARKSTGDELQNRYDDSGAFGNWKNRIRQQHQRDLNNKIGDIVCVHGISKIDWNENASIFINPDGTIGLSVFQGYKGVELVGTSNATQIFGSPVAQHKSGTKDVYTYHFGNFRDGDEAELRTYLLDCEFDSDGKLLRYYVRSDSLPGTDWVRVGI